MIYYVPDLNLKEKHRKAGYRTFRSLFLIVSRAEARRTIKILYEIRVTLYPKYRGFVA